MNSPDASALRGDASPDANRTRENGPTSSSHETRGQVLDDAGGEPEATHYRAIFLSDIHLGTQGCQAEHLLDFLRHHESDRLYLVGDIIDGWAMRSRFYWHQSHNDVIQKVLRKARKGTDVVFIPGNHDEAARQFCGLDFGDIAIRADAVHTMLDGRKMWVVHGDFADGIIRHAKWLAHIGDTLYDFLLWLNRHFNRIRARLGFQYWSLSQFLKQKVKNAVGFISDFEHALMREAKRRGFAGVICGHIHKAEIREVDGMLYCNDGDWVESLTALVETHAGEMKIIVWDQIRAPQAAPAPHWNDGAVPVDAKWGAIPGLATAWSGAFAKAAHGAASAFNRDEGRGDRPQDGREELTTQSVLSSS